MESAWLYCFSLDSFMINLSINLLHLADLKVMCLALQPPQRAANQMPSPGKDGFTTTVPAPQRRRSLQSSRHWHGLSRHPHFPVPPITQGDVFG